jgi:AcrR family transcriptional regulator
VPRTEQAYQQIRSEQRAKILHGAWMVFARGGLAATMADVAAAAGVSQGLAYRYFASKDELFRSLVEEAMRGAGDRPAVMEMPGTPGERLQFMVRGLVEHRRDRPNFYELLDHVLTDEGTPAMLLALVRKRGEMFVKTMRQLIVEAQATGEAAPDDPDQLVCAFFACLEGLSRSALRQREHGGIHFPDAGIVLRMLMPAAGAGSRRRDAPVAGDRPC